MRQIAAFDYYKVLIVNHFHFTACHLEFAERSHEFEQLSQALWP